MMNLPGLSQIGGALSGLMGGKGGMTPARTEARRPSVPGTDTATWDLVEKRYNYARDAKIEMLEPWATALAFYCGEHWRKWEDRSKRMVKLADLPSWRVLMTDNQIPGIVDVAAAKLARSRQLPRALPNTGEPEDQQAAQMGTRALEHWWNRDAMEQREQECNVMRILFGCGFYHDYWDPRKLAKVPVVTGWTQDEMGQPVPQREAKRVPVGDVCVEVLSPFDVFPEPCERFSDASWCIVARRRPLTWFREMFEQGAGVEPDQGDIYSVFSGLIPGAERGAAGGGGAPDGDGQATLKSYYEAPGKQNREGRFILVAGKAVLYDGPLPMPHGEIPVTMMQYRFVPKRMWPLGLVETLIGQQRELNRGQSNLAEVFRLYRSPKRWIDTAWGLKADAITSAPDEVVEGSFRGNNPAQYVESPPNLPAWVSQYPEAQREAIRQLAGQHEVSQGGVPAGVTAASAIGLLQEADNTRLSAPARLGKEALERLSRHVLITMVERYREERLISTLGRDREPQIYALMGSDIGDRDVHVDLTEGVADTDAIRQQQLAEWMDRGLLDWVGGPITHVMMPLLRDVGLTWLAETIAQALPELQQAQAEMQAQEMEMQAALAPEQPDPAADPKLQASQEQAALKQQDAEAARAHEAHQATLTRRHELKLTKIKTEADEKKARLAKVGARK
jgi:hypothetical protein